MTVTGLSESIWGSLTDFFNETDLRVVKKDKMSDMRKAFVKNVLYFLFSEYSSQFVY